MKKYSVFDLEVVKMKRRDGTHQYYICKYNILTDDYVEIFSKMKLNNDKILETRVLAEYYSVLERRNYTTGKPLILPLSAILHKYNEINYVNLYLDTDEDIIEEELNKRGIYEESKVYKKNNKK